MVFVIVHIFPLYWSVTHVCILILPVVPPSSPRIFLASTNPETLFLQWNSPADLNSSGITNYAVTCVGSNSLIHTAV